VIGLIAGRPLPLSSCPPGRGRSGWRRGSGGLFPSPCSVRGGPAVTSCSASSHSARGPGSPPGRHVSSHCGPEYIPQALAGRTSRVGNHAGPLARRNLQLAAGSPAAAWP